MQRKFPGRPGTLCTRTNSACLVAGPLPLRGGPYVGCQSEGKAGWKNFHVQDGAGNFPSLVISGKFREFQWKFILEISTRNFLGVRMPSHVARPPPAENSWAWGRTIARRGARLADWACSTYPRGRVWCVCMSHWVVGVPRVPMSPGSPCPHGGGGALCGERGRWPRHSQIKVHDYRLKT